MKTLYVLALGLLALIPAVSGTAVPAGVATSANVVLQASNVDAQVASSNGTLSRPL